MGLISSNCVPFPWKRKSFNVYGKILFFPLFSMNVSFSDYCYYYYYYLKI